MTKKYPTNTQPDADWLIVHGGYRDMVSCLRPMVKDAFVKTR